MAAPKTEQAQEPGDEEKKGIDCRFWEVKSSAGRNPTFPSAEALLTACMEYVEWTEANPLYEHRALSSGGKAQVIKVPKMRAMSREGLCTFLDITLETWWQWRAGRVAVPGFPEIVARVEALMYTQKFSGAAAELLNPMIIARDLGLREKTDFAAEITVISDTSDRDRAKAVASLLDRLKGANTEGGTLDLETARKVIEGPVTIDAETNDKS